MNGNDLHPLVLQMQSSMEPWEYEVAGLTLRGGTRARQENRSFILFMETASLVLTYAPFLFPFDESI